jgi:heme o synthase
LIIMTVSVAPSPALIYDATLSAGAPRDYFALLKPRVMSLVVFTGAVGMVLAPTPIHPLLGLVAILCIALSAGGAGAVNMWYDRDIDAIMTRTQHRPIPAGRLPASAAAELGVVLIIIASLLMALTTSLLAAGLLAFAAFFYVVIYTMLLKRRTPQNIVIGGAAGAFPPMIGWIAATGEISWSACVLFLITFLWTPPHFWALALYRNDDYVRAGVPMLPVVAGVPATTVSMLIYTLLLLPVSLLPVWIGFAGWLYGAGAAVLGLNFIRHAVSVWRNPSDPAAKAMFRYSLLYLSGIFLILLVDHVVGQFL